LKTKKTQRKFYGKWLYKVSLRLEGCSLFRSKDLLEIIDFCNQEQFSAETSQFSTQAKAWNNKTNLYKVTSFLAKYPHDTWSKRIETDIFDLYTNDADMFNACCEQFASIIRLCYAPSAESLSQLNTPYTIVANKLPHDIYKYKVFLTPHAVDPDITVRTQYILWVESQSPRIKISPAVSSWFLKCRYNWDRRYLLVEDDQTLLMLKLRDGSAIGQTYKYVVAKK
jgi:hypothetical protein